MKVISEHIKTENYKNIYLLYGDEKYLVNQYKNRLKDAIIGDDSINYGYFEGGKIDTREVISMCDTMPFFSERRLVIVENSGFLKSANEDLANYLKNVPEYLIIIFVEEEIDKRNRIFKLISDKGYACEMKYQSESTLSKWVDGLLAKDNKKIERAALALLLDKCGVEMTNIYSEMEKLICYCLDKEIITVADVDAICTVRTENKIFDLVTAIATHKQKQALDLYYDLLTLREAPMRIMFLITRQFNLLLQVKELAAHNIDNKTMASKMGVAPFVVGKCLAQAKNFTIEKLKEALEDMAGVEEAVKQGNMQDKTAVELTIIKYSK